MLSLSADSTLRTEVPGAVKQLCAGVTNFNAGNEVHDLAGDMHGLQGPLRECMAVVRTGLP